MTANKAERKAETKAKAIPNLYCISTSKIMIRPTITNMPNSTSIHLIFFFCSKGSKNEVKKAPVDKHAKVTEILDTLMALKKVNQCSAMMQPAAKNRAITSGDARKGIFLKTKYRAIIAAAKLIRNQTKGKASSVIKAPRMAVNPQIKTMRCKCR